MADFTGSDLTLAVQQAITHPGTTVHAPVEVNKFLAAKWYLWHANYETTANVIGVKYVIQASRLTSGDRDWVAISEIVTGTVAAQRANIAGNEAIGEKTIAVTAGEQVGFVPGSLVFIHDPSSTADGEWHRVFDIPTDIITIADGLAVAKDSSDDILSQAEEFIMHLDLAGIFRIRLITFHRGATGSNITWKSFLRNAIAIE